ncbi:agmatinase family protein [Natranaeroarchaeum aerophilus]|uniref:Agmatinase family protein n=1 Tax=Natranaeroarchaeum aerophilus TaxID=2917711 RepID=A0AAE3K5I0_9EURY|nr:agmatinase family protein [Natranaeroarchaeum aerophilus]MCL9813415.1 agmatinase family protein [Natranaeroarchaeum aerophilus]
MARAEPEEKFRDRDSPGYSGVKTFLGADTAEPEEIDDSVDAAVYGVPYDGAVSNKPGTRYGPEALRAATARRGSYTFESDRESYNIATDRSAAYDEITFRDCGDAPVVPNDIEATYESVVEFSETVSEQTMPIMIGGDHYLTYPAFVGYANAVEDDVGLIHLDAHTDTWGESDLYGEHYHGSPMARIDETEYGGYENHAMVGIRGHADMEFLDIVDDEGLYVDFARDVHEKGIEACIEGAIEHATDGVDQVYLTMDIDVVDPSFAPGTGTPSPGGITSNDFLRAADLLGECDAIGAVDLVEVLPTEDPAGTTSLVGATALTRFLESYFYEDTQ